MRVGERGDEVRGVRRTVIGDDTEGNITWGGAVGVGVRFFVVTTLGLRGLEGGGLAAETGGHRGCSCCGVSQGAGWGWVTSRRVRIPLGSTLGRFRALRRRRWSLKYWSVR